jgi:hypothetical protein
MRKLMLGALVLLGCYLTAAAGPMAAAEEPAKSKNLGLQSKPGTGRDGSVMKDASACGKCEKAVVLCIDKSATHEVSKATEEFWKCRAVWVACKEKGRC